MDLILSLIESLSPYGSYIYLICFLILLACGFGLPLPEDVVLITGGIFASRGVIDFYAFTLLSLFGVLLGDGIIFSLGRIKGPSIKRTSFYKKIISSEREKKINSWFDKYGDKLIFFARFMPGLRMPLFLTAGIYQVPFRKFIGYDGFAAIISVPAWVWLAYVFGSNIDVLAEKISQFKYGLYASVLILLVAVIAFFYSKKAIKNKVGI